MSRDCRCWASLVQRRENWEGISLKYTNILKARAKRLGPDSLVVPRYRMGSNGHKL